MLIDLHVQEWWKVFEEPDAYFPRLSEDDLEKVLLRIWEWSWAPDSFGWTVFQQKNSENTLVIVEVRLQETANPVYWKPVTRRFDIPHGIIEPLLQEYINCSRGADGDLPRGSSVIILDGIMCGSRMGTQTARWKREGVAEQWVGLDECHNRLVEFLKGLH